MRNSNPSCLSQALADHLRQTATSYYPELAGQPFRVRAGKVQRRQFADLCQLQIVAKGSVKTIIAKATLNSTDLPSAAEGAAATGLASRFVPTADPPGSEFNALSTFSKHLTAVDDRRLFSVRVLDSLFHDRVLLLERAEARSLAQSLLRASRLCSNHSVPDLQENFRRTGVCLRAFHGMPLGTQRQPRGTSKREFLDWVAATEELVLGHRYSREYFRSEVPQLLALAQQVLPDRLPVGPVHDDFAPRNVLVNTAGQVAIIDMLDQWTGCVWEDIGQFLFSLGANKPQALTGGRFFAPAVIEKLRLAFLGGYFDREPVPRAALLLYESQLTLSTWAAQWQRLSDCSHWCAAAKRMRLNAAARWYSRQVTALLSQVRSLHAAVPCAQRPSPPLVAGERA